MKFLEWVNITILSHSSVSKNRKIFKNASYNEKRPHRQFLTKMPVLRKWNVIIFWNLQKWIPRHLFYKAIGIYFKKNIVKWEKCQKMYFIGRWWPFLPKTYFRREQSEIRTFFNFFCQLGVSSHYLIKLRCDECVLNMWPKFDPL